MNLAETDNLSACITIKTGIGRIMHLYGYASGYVHRRWRDHYFNLYLYNREPVGRVKMYSVSLRTKTPFTLRLGT